MKLILGSASNGRKKVLEEAGFTFDICPAHIDEKSIRDPDPKVLTQKLAKAKATVLVSKFPDSIILTADTVAWCDNRIYEKPTSAEEFLENYALFQKKPVQLVTGFAVSNGLDSWQEVGVDVVDITYSKIPANVLDAFVAKNTYHLFAGGIEIEEPLLKPYCTIQGDYGTALGLPIFAIQAILDNHI